MPDGKKRSDLDLLEEIREGNYDLFGVIWRRHHGSIVRYVAKNFRDIDAEDIASQVFVETLSAIQRGSGPTSNVRAYLYRAARNHGAEHSRVQAHQLPEDISELLDSALMPKMDDPEIVGNWVLHTAFLKLSDKQRQVLWLMDVESLPPRQVAPVVGMKPNAVSVLAYRARKSLYAFLITEHLQRPQLAADCKAGLEHYASMVAGVSGKNEKKHLSAHLKGCKDCGETIQEAHSSWRRLDSNFVPLAALLSAEGLTEAWSAAVPSGSTPVSRAARLKIVGAIVAAVLCLSLPFLMQKTSTNTAQPLLESSAPTPPTPAENPSTAPTANSPPPTGPGAPASPPTQPSGTDEDAPSITSAAPGPEVSLSTEPDAGPTSSGNPSAPSSSAPATSHTATPSPSPAVGDVAPPTFTAATWNEDKGSVRIAGNGPANQVVKVWASDEPETSAETVPVDAAGHWSLDVPAEDWERKEFSARTLDRLEHQSSDVVEFKTAPPRIKLSRPTAEISQKTRAKVSGQACVACKVDVLAEDGTVFATATPDARGRWEASLTGWDPVASPTLRAVSRKKSFTSEHSAPAPLTPSISSSFSNQKQTVLRLRGIPGRRFSVTTTDKGTALATGEFSASGEATVALSPDESPHRSTRYCDIHDRCSPRSEAN